MTIAPILHQTWKSTRVPAPFRTYQARWRALHPDIEYRLWTDEDNNRFVAQHYPALYAIYRAFPREIFRADMARCLYLHHYGGVYVDLDIEPLRPVDPLLAGRSCLLGSEPQLHAQKLWNKPRLASNAFMASAPGHPFWREMVDEIVRRAKRGGNNPVDTTGPITLDAVYERCGHGLGVELAPPDAFFPIPDLDNSQLDLPEAKVQHFRNMLSLRSFPTASWGVHHWAHTWIPTQSAKRSYLRNRHRLNAAAAVLRSRKTVDEVVRPERYGLLFPEHAFAPRPARRAAYVRAVCSGHEQARHLDVSVLVLLHNRIDLALTLRARLSLLSEPFARARIYVVSDDSTDGTAEVMTDWQTAEPARVEQVPAPTALPGQLVYRRMARLRNALLTRNEQTRTDLTIVLDGDLAGPISIDGVMHAVSLLRTGSADAVAAFGINNWGGLPAMFPFLGYSYYDPIAYREHSWQRSQSDARIRLRLSTLRRGDAPVQVRSAFAGMVIYNSSKLVGLRYDEATNDCEHVSLHKALARRGGRMVVDPSLLLLSGRQGHHIGRSSSVGVDMPADKRSAPTGLAPRRRSPA